MLIQLRDINTGQVITKDGKPAIKEALDTAPRWSRDLDALHLIDKFSDPRDCYVVEMDGEEVIRKYQL